MSDEEIRDLLDLGAADYEFGPPIEAEDTWAAGRRIRTRQSWGVGLGAVAAAALVGVVWTQGVDGGEAPTPPPAAGPEPTSTTPDPTLSATDPTGPDPSLTSVDGSTSTGSPSQGAEDPPVNGDLPGSAGPSILVLMSEGSWEPSGELTPLTDTQAVDRRWQIVDLDREPPQVDAPEKDYGLTIDDSGVRVRSCGVDVTVAGTVADGLFSASGEPVVVEDPDPSSDCPVPTTSNEWVQILMHEPRMSTDGEILVIEGSVEDAFQVPVGMALLPDGVSDPAVGPVTAVTAEDLAAGLTETPGQDIGVSDLRNPQPEHATTLSMQDQMVTVDVGCDEPLRGPAWFTHVGPEEFNWQLTAALPSDPDCTGAAAEDAQLWRQMLAAGVFLHHSGDYVILDSMAPEAAER